MPPLPPLRRRLLRLFFGAACVLAALASAGCEEDVQGVLGADRVFSVYGLFSPAQDTQWVLLYPVVERLEPTPRAPLDARVTSVDKVTGETHVWRDSLIADRRGQYEHFFWAPFRAFHERSYELRIVRSDGETAKVNVQVPPQVFLEIGEAPPRVFPVFQMLRIKGGAPNLLHLTATYTVRYLNDQSQATTVDVPIAYNSRKVKAADGWDIRIGLSQDYQEVLRAVAGDENFASQGGVQLLNVTLSAIVASDDWLPPEGAFSAEVLIEPGIMNNVDNGFGFVGSGYRLARTWLPPREAATSAGFRIE